MMMTCPGKLAILLSGTYPSGNSVGSLVRLVVIPVRSVTWVADESTPLSRDLRLITICPLTASVSSGLAFCKSNFWTVSR